MTKVLNQGNKHSIFLPPGKTGVDEYPFTIPAGEVFHSARLTIMDLQMPAVAQIESQPVRGAQGDQVLRVEWKCKPKTMVAYQVEGFSCPPADLDPGVRSRVTRQMSGFLPSQNGFHFDNSFDPVHTITIQTPFGEIGIGDASKGLCGGMVYAALDYFNAGRSIPPDRTPPTAGSLFDYIVERLFFSFDIPTLGFMKYVEFMNPRFPDFQPALRRTSLTPLSRAWCMIRQEWPVIKKSIDSGHACPLGLVKILSKEVKRLGENHQVLAYGYDLVDDNLALYIYDPNFSDDDTVSLKLNIRDPNQAVKVSYSKESPLYCFFHTDYNFMMPPAQAGPKEAPDG